MRIGIDARFLTHPQVGGFKTYTENLISALARVDSDNQYFLYLDRQPDQDTKLPNASNITWRVVPSRADMVGMVWREQVDLPRQANLDKVDLLHSPCLTAPFYTSCPSVVTIHDMIWYDPTEITGLGSQLRSLRGNIQGWYYRAVSTHAARRATRIITVSQASKRDIVRLLGLSPEKILVTYEAAGMEYRQITDERQIESIKKKFGLCSNYILSLGSSDPRKNIQTLLEAYALLPDSIRENYQLAVVWCHGTLASTMKQRVAELGLVDQVRFLEGVQNEDLILLYNAASTLVFPSIYEGFGLPLLEAMTCGTPVVASNNSCIPEIVERAALLADAKDAKAMARMISVVLSDEYLKRKLISKGRRRVTVFSWNKCALETIEVYQQVVLAQHLPKIQESRSQESRSQTSEVF